jgi:hypothetical protein
MAEMCPHQIRGAVLSAKETVIVGGIVLGYATGNFLSGNPQRWTGRYCAVLYSTLLYCANETFCPVESNRIE